MRSYPDWSKKQKDKTEEPIVQIREATERDLPALEWGGEFSRFRLVYQRALKEANRGRQTLLVAECSDNIVGQLFVLFNTVHADPRPIPYTGYLYSFRVKPQFRNQGIGGLLITRAEEILLERDFRRVLIGVAKINDGARRLYERLGYRIIAEDPGEWSFVDHENQIQRVVEPTYIMEKFF
jgi:ribosomal protein S18 acetylase RimI-like enzyme